MKRILFAGLLFWGSQALAQSGYEIKVKLKPFKNQYIYLGHYFGKTYPIIDSALLNENNEAVFRGNKKLNPGTYLIGYPNKNGFFEILVDKSQQFSIKADTAGLLTNIKFDGSPENTLFNAYQQEMNKRGRLLSSLQQQLAASKTKADSARITGQLTTADNAITQYREEYIKKNPGNILSTYLVAMREPKLTGRLKTPKTRDDSVASYNFYKGHYWDGVNFYDGRLAYTTFFEDKLDKYFNQLIVPHPDSVIKEIDRMLGFASVNEEMNRFLLIKFVNRYLNQKYMWEDAVFVHLYEKYFSNKTYSWLTDKGQKTITDRAYSLMANILGTPASDIELPDTSGKTVALYRQESPYTVVVFWDPTCSHCKDVLPRVDSFYRNKWKADSVRIFAVARETDGNRNDWMKFIRDHRLQDWTNVYYSKEEDRGRINSGIPGYSQLYDVLTFPTLYLLDRDKRIVAKKLSLDQIHEVLQVKIRGQ